MLVFKYRVLSNSVLFFFFLMTLVLTCMFTTCNVQHGILTQLSDLSPYEVLHRHILLNVSLVNIVTKRKYQLKSDGGAESSEGELCDEMKGVGI